MSSSAAFASILSPPAAPSASLPPASSSSGSAAAAATATTTATTTREWRFSQCFGEMTPASAAEQNDCDILSAVEFDQTGKFLATGDRGGRVVIFEQDHHKPPSSKSSSKRGTSSPEYRFYCEFQSHDQEFDYLKSLEIEEKINQIKWCAPPTANSRFLLSANDKTVKLWKIADKHDHHHSGGNGNGHQVIHAMNVNPEAYRCAEHAAFSMPGAGGGAAGGGGRCASLGATLLLHSSAAQRTAAMLAARHATSGHGHHAPSLKSSSQLYIPPCSPKRAFANAHAYHINSVSVCSDGETFLSADDLRINLWHLNVANQTFNIVDIKPDNMEDLQEVITAAEFHPAESHTFAYSNSRGAIKLVDMRQSALCDGRRSATKTYEEEEQPGDKSFFSEIIASISDIKFTRNGSYIVARDYLSLKIWDMKMERRPVKTIPLHEHLKPKLHDLYENDSIFDKFECVSSPDGRFFATGSYHNYLHVFDRAGNQEVIEATNAAVASSVHRSSSSKHGGGGGSGGHVRKLVTDPAQLDYQRKITSLSWHPEQNVIAVCGLNNLYLFTK